MPPDDEEGNIDPMVRIGMLSKAGKGIAEIVKASVLQKQHAIIVREKVEKAAKEVETIVKTGDCLMKQRI